MVASAVVWWCLIQGDVSLWSSEQVLAYSNDAFD